LLSICVEQQSAGVPGKAQRADGGNERRTGVPVKQPQGCDGGAKEKLPNDQSTDHDVAYGIKG